MSNNRHRPPRYAVEEYPEQWAFMSEDDPEEWLPEHWLAR